jgi:hypothetical protein
VKQAVSISIGLWKVRLDIVEGLAPNEKKGAVQSTALREDDDGGTPGPACTLSGNDSGQAALRRGSRSSWRVILARFKL